VPSPGSAGQDLRPPWASPSAGRIAGCPVDLLGEPRRSSATPPVLGNCRSHRHVLHRAGMNHVGMNHLEMKRAGLHREGQRRSASGPGSHVRLHPAGWPRSGRPSHQPPSHHSPGRPTWSSNGHGDLRRFRSSPNVRSRLRHGWKPHLETEPMNWLDGPVTPRDLRTNPSVPRSRVDQSRRLMSAPKSWVDRKSRTARHLTGARTCQKQTSERHPAPAGSPAPPRGPRYWLDPAPCRGCSRLARWIGPGLNHRIAASALRSDPGCLHCGANSFPAPLTPDCGRPRADTHNQRLRTD